MISFFRDLLKTTKTVDGYTIRKGSTIWVRSNIIDPDQEPTQHVVGEIMDYKLKYAEPDDEGLRTVAHKPTGTAKRRRNWKQQTRRC